MNCGYWSPPNPYCLSLAPQLQTGAEEAVERIAIPDVRDVAPLIILGFQLEGKRVANSKAVHMISSSFI